MAEYPVPDGDYLLVQDAADYLAPGGDYLLVSVGGYLAACNLHNLAPDSSDTWGHMALMIQGR